jgi:hypothetical protein
MVSQSFYKEKSLGLDGFLVEFFIGCFEFIENDLRRVFEASRIKGKMFGTFNIPFLALIPKDVNYSFFDKFEPISLCNCIYKIISKVIARRQKKVL